MPPARPASSTESRLTALETSGPLIQQSLEKALAGVLAAVNDLRKDVTDQITSIQKALEKGQTDIERDMEELRKDAKEFRATLAEHENKFARLEESPKMGGFLKQKLSDAREWLTFLIYVAIGAALLLFIQSITGVHILNPQ